MCTAANWMAIFHICEGWFSWPLLQHNWVKHSGDCVTIFKAICIMSFSQLSKMWLLPSRCLQLSEGADLYVNTSLGATRALCRILPLSGTFASRSQYTTASIMMYSFNELWYYADSVFQLTFFLDLSLNFAFHVSFLIRLLLGWCPFFHSSLAIMAHQRYIIKKKISYNITSKYYSLFFPSVL